MAEPDGVTGGSSGEQPSPPDGTSKGPDAAFLSAILAFQKAATGKNAEQAEAAAWDALRLAAERAENDPSPLMRLTRKAGECEANGDWAGAEAAYREALSSLEAAEQPVLMVKAHVDLSRLFGLLGQWDKASDCARVATAIARRTDIPWVQVLALRAEATCALARSDNADALRAATEAVELHSTDPIFELSRAQVLVLRARCFEEGGEIDAAERDLTAAKEDLFGPMSSPLFAGMQAAGASWWATTARIIARKGDLETAAEAWSSAVKLQRHVASLPQAAGPYTLEALASALQFQGEALRAIGQPDEAEKALAEARRIRSELGLPEAKENRLGD